MKKILILLLLLSTLVGCKHNDLDSDWEKVKLPNSYSYYVCDVGNKPADLYVVFGGYPSGYDKKIGQYLKEYLSKKDKAGTVLVAFMHYEDPLTAQWTQQNVIDIVQSMNYSKLFLIGYSAGACAALQMSNDFDSTYKVLAVAAGAYKKIGGKPTDNLPIPVTIAGTLLMNGYDVKTYEKYHIYYDGAVYVDPAVRLAELSDAELMLLPNVSHSEIYKLLQDNDKYFGWLTR